MTFTPTAYRNWYRHLTNQGAHGGLVGSGMALVAAVALPPVLAWLAVVLVYFGYEALIQAGLDDDLEMLWDWRDSLDDTANVGGGAAVLICALSWGHMAAAGAFTVWAASLAYAVWRRI